MDEWRGSLTLIFAAFMRVSDCLEHESDRILTGQRCPTKKFFATPVSFADTSVAAAYSVVKRHLGAVKHMRTQLWRQFVRIRGYRGGAAKSEAVRDTERRLAHQYRTSLAGTSLQVQVCYSTGEPPAGPYSPKNSWRRVAPRAAVSGSGKRIRGFCALDSPSLMRGGRGWQFATKTGAFQ